jgi:DNA-binding Lrp family transcriptional regulator
MAHCRLLGKMPDYSMTKGTLDDLDRRLLRELQADARLPQVTLAARLGLSRSAVQDRIKRLERTGIIRGYTLRTAGEPPAAIRAYLLVKGLGASHERAVRALAALPEVRVADSVSGETDLVLQLEAECMEDLNRVRDEVARLPGIASTRTLLVMQPRFDRR